MINVIIKSPTKAQVFGSPDELAKLQTELTYTNSSISYQLSKLLKNQWAKKRDFNKWQEDINLLKSKTKRTLMWNEGGIDCIFPGSLSYIKSVDLEIKNEIEYPEFESLEWKKPLPFELYPYQREFVEGLIDAKHGCISAATGTGKGSIILSVAQRIGAGTLIVVPYASLFQDMVEACEKHFGKNNVGGLGDGTKILGKPITVAISKSLTNLEPGTEEYEIVARSKAMLIDENHTFGAETLDSMCNTLLGQIPYRFFLSGTQTRGDGSIKLLKSITGPVVGKITTQQAIAGGYICDHEFRIKTIPSTKTSYSVSDPLKMKRFHFLYNKNIAEFIANLANAVAIQKNESTLVLVEELSQIAELIKLLQVPYAYAHSGTNKKELEALGLTKVDSQESIEKFNKGEVKVLLGSGAISVGTNMFPTHHTCNWVGGTSEIKTLQGTVGRSVRKLETSKYAEFHPPKPKSIIWDFDVDGVEKMEDHLADRIGYYKLSGTPIIWIDKKERNG